MIQVYISIFFLFFSDWVVEAETVLREPKEDCPLECTCEEAPLRSASFVLKWMTSWGEDDLPNIHPNDILDGNLIVNSSTAKDAGVDVDQIGKHATCSIHPTTNVSHLLFSLPQNLMVLSILQAPGCNLTIIDGGQLSNLKSLKALHLQGYAHECRKQVSGYAPNKVQEMIKHKKMMEKEQNEKKQAIRLRMALAEDTLQPLRYLELLDMQYVRLVATKEDRRSRRFSSHPVDSKTLLDMPLVQFLRLAERVDNFKPPPYIVTLPSQSGQQDSDQNDINNELSQMESLFTMVQEELLKGGDINTNKVPNREEKENTIDDLKDSLTLEEIIPYDLYLSELQPELAPFKTLAELKYLRVAHASLDRIGPELLDGVQKLHTLTLEYNNVQVLPEFMFSPTPNLRHLSLAHNKLFSLDSESFDGLSQLSTIDLDFNKLSVLGANSLPPLPALETMRVFGNPITHLLPDAFSSLNNSKSLFLGSSNVSMDIHEDTFRFLSSLEILVLENITMSNLEKTLLNGMGNLKKLTVHGDIPVIDYDAFSTMPLLVKLDLSRCRLRKLSMDAFFGLRRLKVLNLSHNKLTSLSPGTFDHLVKLRLLYLHHNKLESLPLGIFLPISAKLIQLNHNPWNCSCDLLQLRPSITNKITKPPRINCIWDDKLETVCRKEKGRLVYDARVAPLCAVPSSLKGKDVYHAALRHLKCNKYHWDPKMLRKRVVALPAQQKLGIPKPPQKAKPSKRTQSPTKGWLPLIAFTPEPIHQKDLLVIAEKEGLEEVAMPPKGKKRGTYTPQSDQPQSISKKRQQGKLKLFTGYNKPTAWDLSSLMKQKEKKKYNWKLKAYLKEKERREQKKRIMKEMEEKRRLKAIIKENQRRFHQKKLLKMKMNLD